MKTLIGVGGAALGWLAKIIIETTTTKPIPPTGLPKPDKPQNRPDKQTTIPVAILGDKGVGKTELWYRLQGKDRTDHSATAMELIKKFYLGNNNKGDKVYIEQTNDIGGGSDLVETSYDKLIRNNSIIYYLVDLTVLTEERKKDTSARLTCITNIIDRKSYSCDIYILATHLDEYGKSEAQAKLDVQEMIGTNLVMNCKDILPIITTDKNYVDKIKKQILEKSENWTIL